MADRETPLKRQREEPQVEEILEEEETAKRHRPSSSSSYNHILSILEAENEEESNQDLSSLMTSLQQELSSSDSFPASFPENPSSVSLSATSDANLSNVVASKEDEEEDKERVIRHLLEASDDELGIPNIEVRSNGDDEVGLNAGDGFGGFGFGDGFWELEDEAANYYTLLQSELFM
ncbi:hypothetical protein RJ641_003002 [Dillenia turbinata]|uniref:Uncharacterized protein n=1 Tax=Dillenia turbinata TaxID=194707 RepID=A0AAN8VD11_9MAGN